VKPDPRFVSQPKSFWANVRVIGQEAGYTKRTRGSRQQQSAGGRIKVPDVPEMLKAMTTLGLASSHIADEAGNVSKTGRMLQAYFKCRADILNDYVEPRLMDRERAKSLFEKLFAELKPACPLPMNKQKREKKAKAFFTGIVNMLIEAHSEGLACDFDPRKLTVVTRDRMPLRTMARRFDGAFPSLMDPIAVWEIKEYYNTKTFGSRVADAVYESLLDGMELRELREHEDVSVKHFLMIDDHYTWWECGRSYLCRLIDMLHMGYVDEVLFGYEVVERLPKNVRQWVQIARSRQD